MTITDNTILIIKNLYPNAIPSKKDVEFQLVSPSNVLYDFNGINGRYFYNPNETCWIALLEDGSLRSLFAGHHYRLNQEYEYELIER